MADSAGSRIGADEKESFHDTKRLHAMWKHSKPLDRLAYIELLENFTARPNIKRLKTLLHSSNVAVAGDRISGATFGGPAQTLQDAILYAMADADSAKLRMWLVPLVKALRKTPDHPFGLTLLTTLAASQDANARLVMGVLNATKPKDIVQTALKEFGAGSDYQSSHAQLGLLTTVCALNPNAFQQRQGDNADKLCDVLLAVEDDASAAIIAKQLVDLDEVGYVLRKRARKDVTVLSGALWRAITNNADNGFIPTNSFEGVWSIIIGGSHKTEGKSREFMRLTSAAVVGPHVESVLTNAMTAATKQRDADVSAQAEVANETIGALEARKSKGFRATLATLPKVGGLFRRFAEARAGRIQQRIEGIESHRNSLRKQAFEKASAARLQAAKASLRFAASMVTFLPRKSDLRAGHHENFFKLTNVVLLEATPEERPKVLSVTGQLVGGMQQPERRRMAMPATYAVLIDDPAYMPSDHALGLRGLVRGYRRSPEALVGYMTALHASGKLPAVINQLVGIAKTDRIVRANMGLFAQALGATHKAIMAVSSNQGATDFQQAEYASLILASDYTNKRFLRGCIKGIGDFCRPQAVLDFTPQAIGAIRRRLNSQNASVPN